MKVDLDALYEEKEKALAETQKDPAYQLLTFRLAKIKEALEQRDTDAWEARGRKCTKECEEACEEYRGMSCGCRYRNSNAFWSWNETKDPLILEAREVYNEHSRWSSKENRLRNELSLIRALRYSLKEAS